MTKKKKSENKRKVKAVKRKKTEGGTLAGLKLAVKALDDKKGEDIKAFNVHNISDMWEYFVMCTGTSGVHIRTLFNNLKDEMNKAGRPILYRDMGLDNRWIIADYGDILVHIFDEETRKYYAIEKMWGEKEVRFSAGAKEKKLKRGKNVKRKKRGN